MTGEVTDRVDGVPATRPLTPHEHGCIRSTAVGNALDPALVDAQLAASRGVVDDLPTAVDPVMDPVPGRIDAADGPLPHTADHEGDGGADSKQTPVWMEGGLVVMAELLSYSDEPPRDRPDPATLVMLDL